MTYAHFQIYFYILGLHWYIFALQKSSLCLMQAVLAPVSLKGPLF